MCLVLLIRQVRWDLSDLNGRRVLDVVAALDEPTVGIVRCAGEAACEAADPGLEQRDFLAVKCSKTGIDQIDRIAI